MTLVQKPRIFLFMASLSHFRKTRARVTRMRDAKQFNGWTVDVSGANVIIHFDEPIEMAPGEAIMFELVGSKRTVMGQGKLQVTMNQDMIIALQGDPKIIPSTEQLRVMVKHWPITLVNEVGSMDVFAVDAAPEGVGFVTTVEYKRGEKVSLDILSDKGSVKATGEIRYCRKTRASYTEYRVGVQLTFDDRIMRARWISNFDLVA